MPDALNNREGPQAREPSAWTGRAMEIDRLKRPSDRQLQETQTKTLIEPTIPALEAVCVPARLASPGSPQVKQMHHLRSQLSLWQSCHRQKSLESMHAGSLWSCLTLCDPVDCGLPGFPVREGGSPGKNTGVCWPILVAIPF